MVFRPVWVIVLIILGILLGLVAVAVPVTLAKYFGKESFISGYVDHPIIQW